jgi:hypothetical protein
MNRIGGTYGVCVVMRAMILSRCRSLGDQLVVCENQEGSIPFIGAKCIGGQPALVRSR